jgi:glycosyltransferase involved in cell wall biosynthesis
MADSQMTFGIVVPTYFRHDGSTHFLLTRAIASVSRQTYTDWRLFLVGDHYVDQYESDFWMATSRIPPHKFQSVNLPWAVERDSGMTGDALWRAGGSAATNFGLAMARAAGCRLTAHLDDDDVWAENHLETLMTAYRLGDDVAFAWTRGTRGFGHGYLPTLIGSGAPKPLMPRAGWLSHSCASWRLDLLDSMYLGKPEVPGDADLWTRMAEEMLRKGLRSFYIPIATVIKENERRMVIDSVGEGA